MVEDNNSTEPDMLWEMIKLKIRVTSIKYSSKKKELITFQQSELPVDAKNNREIIHGDPDLEIKNEVDLITEDIEQIIDQ